MESKIDPDVAALLAMSSFNMQTLILAIYRVMDGKEWNTDTHNTIARLFFNAGMPEMKEPE